MKPKARSYVSQDHDNLVLPIKFDVIAVRRRNSMGRTSSCDVFCLHALLTGTAKKVQIFIEKDLDQPLSAAKSVAQYSLEKRDICPEFKFTARHHRLELPTDKGSQRRPANAVEELKLRNANGECLVLQQSTLGEADLVVTFGRLVSGPAVKSPTGFSFKKMNIPRVDRISVHTVNKADGTFDEVYRWTGVRYGQFSNALIPVPLSAGRYSVEMGWARFEKRLNIKTKLYRGPNWPQFLTESLGLDLRLDGEETKDKTLSLLEEVLREKRAPTPQEWGAVNEYFDRVGIGRYTELVDRDYKIAVEMLNNPAFPPMPRLYNIARYSEKHQSPEDHARLADTLLTRLERGRSWPEDLPVDFEKTISLVASGLIGLPEGALSGQFDRIEKLSHDPVMQLNAWKLFKKLHVFGEKAVPTFLRLIEIGLSRSNRKSRYQPPYLAGIGGLCLAGPSAKSALPHLIELLNAGKIYTGGSYGELLMYTLTSLKADPEVIWPLYSKQWKNKTREDFNKHLESFENSNWSCSL